mmetsp:Transcript_60561/g.107995  ORF Transcript_60561/g.107995 Transcript_60561/m.107995 type:complete len:211 (+) Transcript_60561:1766-2398(+)
MTFRGPTNLNPTSSLSQGPWPGQQRGPHGWPSGGAFGPDRCLPAAATSVLGTTPTPGSWRLGWMTSCTSTPRTWMQCTWNPCPPRRTWSIHVPSSGGCRRRRTTTARRGPSGETGAQRPHTATSRNQIRSFRPPASWRKSSTASICFISSWAARTGRRHTRSGRFGCRGHPNSGCQRSTQRPTLRSRQPRGGHVKRRKPPKPLPVVPIQQ